MAVAKRMEHDRWKSAGRDRPAPVSAQVVRRQWLTLDRAEHERVTIRATLAECQARLDLRLAVRPQRVDRARRERDRAPAVLGLGCLEAEPDFRFLDTALDADRRRVEIDIAPA